MILGKLGSLFQGFVAESSKRFHEAKFKCLNSICRILGVHSTTMPSVTDRVNSLYLNGSDNVIEPE
jgi:hypothetical protein